VVLILNDLSRNDNAGMLILSRKEGEQIIIGADISVRVVSILGGRVKLGVAAPKNVSVNREEIELKIKNQELVMPGYTQGY